MFESYAQNFEDVVLWRALGHIEHGTYVDVGAADPDDDSVTHAFYERGWTGLNVEPVAEFADRLRAARPADVVMQVCAGAEPDKLLLHVVRDTGLSTLSDRSAAELAEANMEIDDVEMEVRRLDEMLADAGFDDRAIHFLKIDVEGFEADVLAGMDFDRFRPWIVVVEATAPRTNEPTHESWEHLLTDQRYRFCLFDGLNRFYLADEHAELATALSYPACVFDHPFLTPPHRALLAEHRSALEGVERIEAAYRDTLDLYQQLEAEFARANAAHEALLHEHERALESYHQLEKEHERVSQAWRDLDSELSRVTASWHELDAEQRRIIGINAELSGEIDALKSQCETYRVGVKEMAAEVEELRRLDAMSERNDQAEMALEAVLNSTSWRVTAPLRRVLDRVRR